MEQMMFMHFQFSRSIRKQIEITSRRSGVEISITRRLLTRSRIQSRALRRRRRRFTIRNRRLSSASFIPIPIVVHRSVDPLVK